MISSFTASWFLPLQATPLRLILQLYDTRLDVSIGNIIIGARREWIDEHSALSFALERCVKVVRRPRYLKGLSVLQTSQRAPFRQSLCVVRGS